MEKENYKLMLTSISIGVSVLITSWLAARAARLWGFEDLVFALSMVAFVTFGVFVIVYPLFGFSVQQPVYLILLTATILFGFMSAWMGQE